MAAAFFKKNTLEQTAFTLNADGFSYRGKNYEFGDVIETLIYRVRYETKVLLVGSDFDHAISVVFVMKGGEKIQITEQPTWFSNSKVENVEKIHEIYNVVSINSCQNRLNKYVTQIESSGFFEYAGWQFFPISQKLIHIESQQEFDIQNCDFKKGYGSLEVVNKADSVSARFMQSIRGSIVIGTLKDTDVFYILLKHYFGIA